MGKSCPLRFPDDLSTSAISVSLGEITKVEYDRTKDDLLKP